MKRAISFVEISDSESENDVPIKKKIKKERKTEKRDVIRKKSNRTTLEKVKHDKLLNTNSDIKCIVTEENELKHIKNDKSDVKSMECKEWTEVDYLCEVNNIDTKIAENLVKLFKDDNTIPFIARYRKHLTDAMEPDTLRSMKESFDQAKLIKQRALSLIKTIDKLGKWSPEIHSTVISAKNLDDLEYISSLFKTGVKKSLADRARDLGLESVSVSILKGLCAPRLTTLVNPEKDGLQTEKEIKDGIIYIMADAINKNKMIFNYVKELRKKADIQIHVIKSKNIEEKDTSKNKLADEEKFKIYYDFKCTEKLLKPHQILAINRGEAQKILSVKLVLSENTEKYFRKQCLGEYRQAVESSSFHKSLIEESIAYTYKKFVKPLIIRRTRNEMKTNAETASIEVFATNLKQLLLIFPVRGKIIMGIDPGFRYGCKIAVISQYGQLLDTAVIYPNIAGQSIRMAKETLINLIKKHNCTLIALGNGTACRETESFLSNMIQSKAFGSLDVQYTIVDEAGASIYSCSEDAKSEYSDLDPNLISAISIAKRLQDPLAELVKIDPKNLGIGMYQHDLPKKQLALTLNEVISEVVSFVGVDVNTASNCLLKRVAGLNASRAAAIIDWKNKNGPFINRNQLKEVKGIGSKTFEQCAGFIRILPETASIQKIESKPSNKKQKQILLNPLDQTWIHPESYNVATAFMKYCSCNPVDIGSADFIRKIEFKLKSTYIDLAKIFETDEKTMEVIAKGLTMKKGEDIRLETNFPLFIKSMKSIHDLKIDAYLTGVVRNITHFGAFVDVGLERAGLIPIRYFNNYTLSIGQRVEVQVLGVDNNKFSLKLVKVF